MAIFAAVEGRAEQPASPVAVTPPDAADKGAIARPVIPEGAPVDFEIVEGISSKTATIGQRFAIRLVEPILAGPDIAVPAGATGEGEVVHAARAGAAGKAGELVLSARFIEMGGQRIPLRGFRFGQSGASRSSQAGAINAALAGASVFVPLPPIALLITGKNVDVTPLTRGTAKVARDIVWSKADVR